MDRTNDEQEFSGKIFEPITTIYKNPSKLSKEELSELFESREDKTFHWVKIVLICVFGLYVIVMSGVVLFHLLAPVKCRWLSEQEVTSLEKMFATGIGAALLGKFGNKLADFK